MNRQLKKKIEELSRVGARTVTPRAGRSNDLKEANEMIRNLKQAHHLVRLL